MVTKSPDIEVVSNVSQIDIADAVLLVDSDVLPVKAGGSLQLNVSQPSTWSMVNGQPQRLGSVWQSKALTVL